MSGPLSISPNYRPKIRLNLEKVSPSALLNELAKILDRAIPSENRIDSKLAGLFCVSLKKQQNTITQEKLDALLGLIKRKLTKLIFRKQIEPLLAKSSSLLNDYRKTIGIV